jgi:hypothetical protein
MITGYDQAQILLIFMVKPTYGFLDDRGLGFWIDVAEDHMVPVADVDQNAAL